MSDKLKMPNQAHDHMQIMKPGSPTELALQTVQEMYRLTNSFGFRLVRFDKNLHKIELKISSVKDLLQNPEFMSILNQSFYLSNPEETTWFQVHLKNGKIVSISFLLSFKVRWVKFLNKNHAMFDHMAVCFSPGDEQTDVAIAVIPYSDFTPEKILKHFPPLAGQTSLSTKETGNLICYILSKYLDTSSPEASVFCGKNQGFGKNLKGKIMFSPVEMIPSEFEPFLPPGITARQYPRCAERNFNTDLTPVLAPTRLMHRR